MIEVIPLAEIVIADCVEHGKVAKGAAEVIRSIQKGKARLVFLGKDVDLPALDETITDLCLKASIPVCRTLHRKELGELAKTEVPASSLAVLVPGRLINDFWQLVFSYQEADPLRCLIVDTNLEIFENGKASFKGWHLPAGLQVSKDGRSYMVEKISWEKDTNDGWVTTYSLKEVCAAKA